jgi:hypothetical protein
MVMTAVTVKPWFTGAAGAQLALSSLKIGPANGPGTGPFPFRSTTVSTLRR